MPATALVLTAAAAWAASDAAVVAGLTYVRPTGERTEAFRLTADGTAVVDRRGERFVAQLPAAAVARLRERLSGEWLCGCDQAALDEDIRSAAPRYGLVLPVPHADRCELTLPGGTVASVGPGVLAARMPGVPAAADFERLRSQFEQLAAVVVLGGVFDSHAFLRAAAEATGEPVRLSDLSYADSFGGERTAQFALPRGLVVVTSRGGEPPTARLLQTAAR